MLKSHKKAAVCLLLAAVVICGGIFAHNLNTYIRQTEDAREAARQAELMRQIIAEHNEAMVMRHAYSVTVEHDRSSTDKDEVQLSPIIAAREAAENDDIVAYIYIPHADIKYAVAHGTDNEFYLHHDLLRRRSASGSIFLDYACSPDFTSRSSIIYGHNMRNGTKFSNLAMFLNEEFFTENRYITLTALHDVLRYEVFSVFETHISFNYIQVEFYDDAEFLTLIHEIKERSVHSGGSDITGDDRILILSTCTGPQGGDYRLVVAARLLE